MKQGGEKPTGEELIRVEELLIRLTTLRRHPRYRQILADGTGFEGRITTMRILRAIDGLCRGGSVPSIREVAERLGMEHSNTSRAIDDCVERALVSRRQSETDGRRSELTITTKGRQAIRRLDSRRSVVHRQLLEGWEPSELHQLAVLLERLAQGYEKLEQ
ncbi:MAG: MarR family transcriptional regulator [Hyphomicrobiales bacterium]|nr:MAG: MarR family transcriptional regulator [Hyphomicrobiales bacterium]